MATITFVDSNVSTGATIVCPGAGDGAAAGDFAVLLQFSVNAAGSVAPSEVLPSGFTSRSTGTVSSGAGRASRCSISDKVLTAGDLGATLTGMDGDEFDHKIILVFHADETIATVVPSTPTSQSTTGNPSSQSIAMTGESVPLIGVAHYAATTAGGATVDPRTWGTGTPTEVTSGNQQYAKYIIYNSSPATTSIDMDDEGQNSLQGIFYEFTFSTTQALTPSLVTNTQTFHAATVTRGAVTLAPSLFTNTQTFYGPTVSQDGAAQELLPALVTNAQTFFSPTVTPGAVTLAPALVTNAQTFPAATVTPGAVTLTPDLFTNTQTFYGPTVEGTADEQTAITGGWLSEEQVRALQRRVRKAERAERERRAQKDADRRRLRETLERAYERVVNGVVPAPDSPLAAVTEAVEGFTATLPSDGLAPHVVVIDWGALAADLEAVRALVDALAALQAAQAAAIQDEEDAVLALLMA